MSTSRSEWRRHATHPTALLAAAAVVVLTAAAWFGGVAPGLARQARDERDRQRVAELQREARELTQTHAQRSERLRDVMRGLDDDRLDLGSIDDLNARVAAWTELATERGLRVEHVQPGRVRIGRDFHAVTMRLAAAGTFRDVTGFLDALHKTMPDCRVHVIDLVADPEAPGVVAFTTVLEWTARPPRLAEY